jgi:hypothetical protein
MRECDGRPYRERQRREPDQEPTQCSHGADYNPAMKLHSPVRSETSAVFATFAVLLGLSAAALAQAPRQDGRWEVKMEMEMAGMPGMPPMTSIQCITPDEAKDPKKSMPQAGGRGGPGDCTVSDHKVTGNKVTWTMACTGADAMTGTGEFVYAGDTYTGTMKMNRAGQVMTMKYSGKRLGDCTK